MNNKQRHTARLHVVFVCCGLLLIFYAQPLLAIGSALSWNRLPSDQDIERAINEIVAKETGQVSVNGQVVDQKNASVSRVIKYHNPNLVGSPSHTAHGISAAAVFLKMDNIMGSRIMRYQLIQDRNGQFGFIRTQLRDYSAYDSLALLNNEYERELIEGGSALGFPRPWGGAAPRPSTDDWELDSVDFVLGLVASAALTIGLITLIRRLGHKKPAAAKPDSKDRTAKDPLATASKEPHPNSSSNSNADDWQTPVKYGADLVDKFWGAGGEEGYKAFIDALRKNNLPHWNSLTHTQYGWQNALSEKNRAAQTLRDFLSKESWLDSFGNRQWRSPNGQTRYDKVVRDYSQKSQTTKKAAHELANQSRIFNKNSRFIKTMRSVGSGVSTGLQLAGLMQDTLSNMTPQNRPDGSLIEGDQVFIATGKAQVVNMATSKLVEHNPTLAILELANFVALGDVPAGDITSPLTTIKGSMNYALDFARDPQLAIDRAQAGAYGGNVRSLRDAYEVGKAFYTKPDQAFDDIGDVMQDERFFLGMHDTNYHLWRSADGTQGRIAATAEAVFDMGIAMTQTASDLTASVAQSAGTLFENTSLALRQQLTSVRRFFRR